MNDPLLGAPVPPGRLDPADNPFTTGPGQIPPVLAGRHDVLVTLRDQLDRLARQRPADTAVLEGRRGIGRTAVLHRLAEAATDRGLLTVTLHPDTAWEPAALADAAQHLDPSGGDDATRSLRHLLAEAERQSRQVLVLVDDAHRGPDRVARVLDEVHRATRGRGGAAAVVAGIDGTADALGTAAAGLDRLPVVELGLLGRAAVHDALATPFARHGVAVEAEAVAGVLVHSGGHPHHVQLWGRELWGSVHRRDGVTPELLDEVAPRVQRGMDQIARRVWARLDDPERRYLEATARLGQDRTRPDVVADRLGPVGWDVTDVTGRLLRMGVLASVGDGDVELAWPRMGEWIARRTAGALTEELARRR